jgi:MFS transporter, PAT family, beta-lactamase induction signal transducer AmpG
MSSENIKKQHFSLFFLLYFFEGAPMGLIWWTIPALLATEGFSIAEITTLGASATLPWSIKFILGPVVDRYISTVRQHAWTIATLQIGMTAGIASLLIVSTSNPLILWFVLIISFFSASQDVVIDAWAIASIPEDQKGKANGAMQAGLLIGRWFFGAGLLIALSYISFKLALYFLIGLTLLSICFLFLNYKKQIQVIAPSSGHLSFKSFGFIFNKKFLLLALVALTTGFALEGFTAVISPFLVEYGLVVKEVGGVLSITLFSMLIGSIFGGLFVDKYGDLRMFSLAIVLLAVSVLAAGYSFYLSYYVFIPFVVLTYFFVGFFTTCSYAYYMNKSKGAMEASKFTFLMAITNFCEVFAAFSMGKLITNLSLTYFLSFLICVGISLAGLFILNRLVNNKLSTD